MIQLPKAWGLLLVVLVFAGACSGQVASEPPASSVVASASSKAATSPSSETTTSPSGPAAPTSAQSMKAWRSDNQRAIIRGFRQWVLAVQAYGEGDWDAYVVWANRGGITLSTIPDSPDGPKASYWLNRAGEDLIDASRQYENGYADASRDSLDSSVEAIQAYQETINRDR